MSTSARWRAVLLGMSFLVATIGLELVRQPGHRTWDTVWAEDGKVYLADAYHRPLLSTLFRGYAGYVQLVPRFVVLPARVLPVQAAATYLAFAAAAIAALLALFVYRCTEGWVSSPVLRWLVAMLAVLTPVMVAETNANIANLGWPLLFASCWAVVSQQDGRADTIGRATVVGLTALSNPVVAVLVPFAVVAAVVRRRLAEAVVVTVLAITLVMQFAIAQFAQPGPIGHSRVSDLPTEFGVRVVSSVVFGEEWLAELWSDRGAWLVVAAFVGLAGYVVLAAPWRQPTTRWWLIVGGTAASLLLFAVPVWLRGTDRMRIVSGTLNGTGARYVVVPWLLLVCVLVVLVDGSGRKWLTSILVVHMVFLGVSGFSRDNSRSAGPSWRAEVGNARTICREQPEQAEIFITITPADGWFVSTPCGRLR